MKIISIILAAFFLSISGLVARAETVTIITSFSKDVTKPYKEAFEKANPGITLEILNKNTILGISYVRELTSGQRPEIFWASAPDAFEVLASENLLVSASDIVNKNVPEKIGNYPVNGPNDMYLGQALSGYGIMYNLRYLVTNNLTKPVEWSDLLSPMWFGHVGITSPSRSGTMHLTVETILQGQGWNDGWNTILHMAGNSSAVTERSFGVPDGINNGQFGAGPVIDFFGLSSKYSGFPVDFVYPTLTAIVPANIALINGSKNPVAAKKFVQFALNKQGQEILLMPKLSRLPVIPYKDLADKIPPGYPDPYAIAKNSKVTFDANLSQNRYEIVQALFDQTITFRLNDLQAATKAIYMAESKLGIRVKENKIADKLNQARILAWSPLINAEKIQDKELLKLFSQSRADTNIALQIAKITDEWNVTALANYKKAVNLAEEAAKL